MRRLSLSMTTQLSLGLLVVAVASVAITSVVAIDRGRSQSDEVVERRLEAVNVAHAERVATQLRRTETGVLGLGGSETIARSLAEFTEAFDLVTDEVPAGTIDGERRELIDHVRDGLANDLARVRGRDVSERRLVGELDAGVHLRHAYAVASELQPSRVRSLDDADDGTTWSDVHARRHADLAAAADLLGAEDLLLVDTDGVVVYSVEKRADFGTVLGLGPASGTGAVLALGQAMNSPGTAAIVDLGAYPPAGDRPIGWAGATVGDLGVVLITLPMGPTETTTTMDGEWEQGGLGDTGESYVIGADGRFRTEARGFLEDREAFLDAGLAAGTFSESMARTVRATDTSVLAVSAGPDLADAAVGQAGSLTAGDQVGTRVVAVHRPIEEAPLGWSVVTSISVGEMEEVGSPLVTTTLLTMLVVALVVTFGASTWARRVTSPLRLAADRLAVAAGDEPPEQLDPFDTEEAYATTEFVAVSEGVDAMLDQLNDRETALAEASREHEDLLATVLPAQVVRRYRRGDRVAHDTVADGTVVVVGVVGISEALDRLDDLLAAVDDAATATGVQRVKLLGDSVIGVSGAARPLIDHALRATRFAAAVAAAVEKLDEEDLHVVAGIASGPLQVGLTGRDGLVYDVWGPTMDEAIALVQRGRPGVAAVSDRARDRLGGSVEVRTDGDRSVVDLVALGEEVPS